MSFWERISTPIPPRLPSKTIVFDDSFPSICVNNIPRPLSILAGIYARPGWPESEIASAKGGEGCQGEVPLAWRGCAYYS